MSRSRRSKGCLACRKSKVKCNEDQPRCARCTRQSISCHYPDPLEIDFRNENTKAAVRAVSLWRQRATAVPSPSPSPPPGDDDLQHHALATFYRDFGCTVAVANPWLEFFQMLPMLHRHPAGNPASAQAIRALALAHHARQQQQRQRPIPQLEILARTEYSKAIGLIRSQLQTRNGVPGTDVIVSVSLMGLFETILPSSASGAGSGGKEQQHRSWQAHQHGAISLIQQQQQQQQQQSPQRSSTTEEESIDPRLLKFMYLLMIVNCLNARSRPQLPLHLWTGVLDPRLPAARLFRTMYHLAQWQADLDSWMQAHEKPRTVSNPAILPIEEMITTLMQADRDLQEWESHLPPAFHFYDRPPTPQDHPLLQWPGAPRRVYVYESSWRAIPRTFGFAVRILLAQNLLRCRRWIAERDPDQSGVWLRDHRGGALEVITEMVGHISRSTNAIVGPTTAGMGGVGGGRGAGEGEAMRGLAIVWPLSVVVGALQRSPGVRDRVGEERARWIGDALLYVRRLVGSRENDG
ncbi:Zn(II)2Cys6 transcription factor domain-containing protein [Aspergillus fijiensis CBS 313.89]|uniref:Zn(2)-C6 fungal-type domain-containing protein n=1 Tax=Aspergillus fijiensis CBS 313.89 TaxID=1448319 RepID=A0A8G1VZI5_9EURO|nr:uncharacterized protein BO72DRAFT_527692 [Aspergillus fijiensis CBS 313.89]RAK77553.1 hypothetical protein BO72DRAFT_527692 [Aspergillus fijiensis CBS 313.89]